MLQRQGFRVWTGGLGGGCVKIDHQQTGATIYIDSSDFHQKQGVPSRSSEVAPLMTRLMFNLLP